MDLELRGEGPAVTNLGVVTVLMVFKKGCGVPNHSGSDAWRAGGTSWHPCLVLPGRATPGTWSNFAESILDSSRVFCRV